LDVLRKGHSISAACRAIGVSRTCIHAHRHAEPEFNALVEDALLEGGELLEDEARRRAVEGVDKPIFGRDGRVLTTVHEYSDTLLIFLLKGRMPQKYKDRVQQEQSGDVTVRVVYGRDRD